VDAPDPGQAILRPVARAVTHEGAQPEGGGARRETHRLAITMSAPARAPWTAKWARSAPSVGTGDCGGCDEQAGGQDELDVGVPAHDVVSTERAGRRERQEADRGDDSQARTH
jgi:hypothetical protein